MPACHSRGRLRTMSLMRDVRPGNPAVKLTYDDFLLFPDDGKRHELIDGEHYVTPSPNTKHQTIAMNLAGMIWSYLQNRPLGRVFSAPFEGTRKRDETIKRRLHERFAVEEYWIVDPEIDIVKVYRRAAAGGCERVAELALERSDVLTTPLLPGLDLPLTKIFEGPIPENR
jgi:Uma2 family endonuclease